MNISGIYKFQSKIQPYKFYRINIFLLRCNLLYLVFHRLGFREPVAGLIKRSLKMTGKKRGPYKKLKQIA